MYHLSQLAPIVQATVLASSLKDYQKIAYRAMASALFKDVSIDGKLAQQPVVVIDTSESNPAMVIVVRFVTPKLDDGVYTFQFEAWPNAQIRRVRAPWLRDGEIAIPDYRMKVSFLAERNSVAYYSHASEGSPKHCLRETAQVLGR